MDNFIIGQIFADVSAHVGIGYDGWVRRDGKDIEELGAGGCSLSNGHGPWIEMSKMEDPEYNYHIVVFGSDTGEPGGEWFVKHFNLADPDSIDNLKLLAKETLCHRTELPSK